MLAGAPTLNVSPQHLQTVHGILLQHVPHCTVWAFGSRTQGTAKPYSDLDLAVISPQPLPLATLAALAEDFSESDLPWRVDVLDWATTSAEFQRLVENHHVVVTPTQTPHTL